MLDGKVLGIAGRTRAIIDGIEHKTSGRKLDVYYDDNFDASKHTGTNYFSYGSDRIWLGGSGFSSKIDSDNKIFTNLQYRKEIQGSDDAKLARLQFTPENGNLELSRDQESKLNVKYNGDVKIENGRIAILSANNQLYTSQLKGFDITFDMGINDKYIIEDSSLKNLDGSVVSDYKQPWESTIGIVKALDPKAKNSIKGALESSWNVRPREFLGYVNDEREEDLVRWVYAASETASQNKYGVKVEPSEVFTTLMLEGAGSPNGFIERKYYDFHNYPVDGYQQLGTDFIGDEAELAKLKQDRFVPEDLGLKVYKIKNEHGVVVTTGEFENLKQGLIGMSGVLAERKHAFLQDFKKTFGEQELKKLSKDEVYFWTSFYYNCGVGCGRGELTGNKYKDGRGNIREGRGRDVIYKPLEQKEDPNVHNNPRVNALRRMVTKKYIDSFETFDYPS